MRQPPKKYKAFTLAEVLLALFILTGSVYVLSGLTFRGTRRVLSSTDEVERIFYIKKQLYNSYLAAALPQKQKDKPLKIALQDPEVIITAHRQEIDAKKSSLKDLAKTVDIIWAQGEWKRGLTEHKIKMISFVPKQIKDKS